MEEFLETLFIVLPALRIDMFEERARPEPAVTVQMDAAAPQFFLRSTKSGADARARLVNGEFIVEQGSLARGRSGRSTLLNGKLLEELLRVGVLVAEGEHLRFTQSYAFSSPSGASDLVLGYSSNGRQLWKTASGQRYEEWEASTLSPLKDED
jgi:hypothetical protein